MLQHFGRWLLTPFRYVSRWCYSKPKAGNFTKQTIKAVVVGDAEVGKQSFQIRYIYNPLPDQYFQDPLVDNYCSKVTFNGSSYLLELHGISRQEKYKRLRLLNYQGTDVFILCYSIENRSSFENIRKIWHAEIRRHCPAAKMLLVACKIDLRSSLSRSEDSITTREGQFLANELNILFCEISSQNNIGVEECMQSAIKLLVDCSTNKASCFG